jgi:hypothetical protein
MRIATLVLYPPISKEVSPHCGLVVVAMTGRDDRRRFKSASGPKMRREHYVRRAGICWKRSCERGAWAATKQR